jgi:hypothetical protein
MEKKGSLKDVNFPALLISLSKSLEKGELKIKGRDKEISIFVDNGFIVHATSTDFKDSSQYHY